MNYIKNINILFQEAMDIMDDLNIEVGTITEVCWNGRFRSVWGKCYYNRPTDTYRIELNPILRLPDVSWEDAMNTMIHEVLHAHKDRFCHTGEWKRYAELINREYSIYHIERCTSAEDKNVADKMIRHYKYIVKCNNCGREYKYQKAGAVIKSLRKDRHSCKCCCGNTDLSVIKC